MLEPQLRASKQEVEPSSVSLKQPDAGPAGPAERQECSGSHYRHPRCVCDSLWAFPSPAGDPGTYSWQWPVKSLDKIQSALG